MIADLAQAAPVDLATLHAAAQARIRRHPAGIGYHGVYQPLLELVDRAGRFGGPLRVAALAACQDVANADDATLVRMFQDRRVAPGVPTGAEIAAVGIARHQTATAVAALAAPGPRVTLAEQLTMLEQRGCRFVVVDDQLHVHAPPGTLTDADRRLIRESKLAIVAHLHSSMEVF